MTQTNHFDAHLDTNEHEDPNHDSSEVDVTDVATSDKPKRKLPTNYLLYGAVAVAVLGFWGFKKMSQPSSPAEIAASAPMSDGGMMGASGTQRPAAESFAPVQPAPQGFARSQPAEQLAEKPPEQPASNNNGPTSAIELPASNTIAGGTTATSMAANDALPAGAIPSTKASTVESGRKESTDSAILEQLKAQTAQLEDMGKRLSALETRRVEAKAESKPVRASKPLSAEDSAREKSAGVVRAKASRSRSSAKEEVQLGYKIKQVIPGQAWLEDDSGKQYVKAKGDKLGGSEIVEIDADKYIVRTTAGIIR
ncbi:hypothetical protein LJR296_008187 [Cupriavidus necator]|uniref:hypothetical protein n=1 Tax=Cupriavidus necator TaxID=106590 RepID=UPI003ED07792